MGSGHTGLSLRPGGSRTSENSYSRHSRPCSATRRRFSAGPLPTGSGAGGAPVAQSSGVATLSLLPSGSLISISRAHGASSTSAPNSPAATTTTKAPRLTTTPAHHETRTRQRSGNSSENSSDSLVALVDHARAERPGLDQVQSNVFGDRRQVRRAAADDDRVAKDAQLVNEAELDRCRGEAGAADLDVLVGRVERRGDLFGEWRLGEAGVALNAVERAAEDDLRERAPGVGERGRVLVVLQRRIRLPHQHRLVEPAAQQAAPELADLLEVEAKLLVARNAPSERAVAVGDEAVHRDAHRVDQHGLGSTRRRLADRRRALR